MLKKVFSVHLSKKAYSHLTDSLCLPPGAPISRACTLALKDALKCQDPQDCAQEISKSNFDFNEPLDSPRVVVSSSKCERHAIDLASKMLQVSPNQIASVLTNAAILSNTAQQLTEHPQLNDDNVEICTDNRGVDLNAAQRSVISHLNDHGWADKNDHLKKTKKTQQSVDAEAPHKGAPTSNVPSINYCEMGTGAGKTLLALLLACTETNKKKRTWIAVPSLSIQKQFLSEFKKWFGQRNSVLMSLVSGRSEFVSEKRLSDLIDQQRNQINTGNRKKKSSSINPEVDKSQDKTQEDWDVLATRWMDKIADKAYGLDRRRWLIDSFYEHVPNFPYADSDICLNSEVPTDDPGEISYRDQFDLADRADIVVLTHHYLCLETISRVKAGLSGLRKDDTAKAIVQALYSDARIGKSQQNRLTRAEVLELIDQKNEILSSFYDPNEVGRLNLPDTLIVDEAHLLEENFSKASTIKISVRRLPVLFSEVASKKGIKTEKSITLIQKSLQSLSAKLSSLTPSDSNSSVFLNWSAPTAAVKTVVSLVEDLATLMTEFTVTGNSQEAMSLRSAQYAFRRMIKAARYNVALFTNSPIRQYPQILFGSSNHTSEFRLLFRSMGIDKTLLLSATIYLPNIAGAWSSNRFLSTLGLQTSEAHGYRSNQEPWLVDPVTLFMPPKPSDISKDFGAGHHLLVPSNDAALTKKWLSQLTALTHWVASTAHGGALVLMTSYDSATQLHSELNAQHPSLYPRLLVSQPKSGKTVPELKREFISMYLSGIKPIWIAVGNAWTGLNLSSDDIDPQEDNLLTDLIIARTPYGFNRSISAAAKGLTASKHIQSLEEAGLTLKQGVGRLVRRAGLPKNRRLFFADSRIYDKDKKTLLNMSTALLRNYVNRGQIPRPVIKEMVQLDQRDYKKSEKAVVDKSKEKQGKTHEKKGSETTTKSVEKTAKKEPNVEPKFISQTEKSTAKGAFSNKKRDIESI